MYSIDTLCPVDDLCPVDQGFLVANGYACMSQAPDVSSSLTDHIPGMRAVKDKYERKRDRLRRQGIGKDALREGLREIYKAETRALSKQHTEWENRYGKRP